MRIGIVTGFSLKNAAGLEQAFLQLFSALEKEKPEGVEYVIYTGISSDIEQAIAKRRLSLTRIIHIGFGALWKHIGLFFASHSDVYLYNGPFMPPFFAPRPSCVLVYDFAYQYETTRSLAQKMRLIAMNFLTTRAFVQSEKIIAISEATRKDVGKFFGQSAMQKTVVAPLGFKNIAAIAEVPVSVPKDGYFLFVGTVKERKNVLNLIRGFIHTVKENEITQHLLLAGHFNADSAYGAKISETIMESGLTNRIHFLGQISDEQLRYLYAHATAFLFPSKLEGFGMPVLEAMSIGVPVLTSNTSSLPEIAGNAALLVNPDEVLSIGNGIARLAQDSGLREQLAVRGPIQAAKFSWLAAAKIILSELKSIQK